VLKRIIGLERDRMVGNWRKLYNEGLHDLCSSSDTIRMIKSRSMRWAGHDTLREKRNACTIFMGNPEGKRPLGRHRLSGRIILK
jgi:hypothetical protein